MMNDAMIPLPRLLKHLANAAAAALLLAGVLPSAAQACSGQIMSSPNPSADYNPFDPVANVRSYTVTIENRAAETCVFWLRFEPPLGAGGWSGDFDFEIRSETGVVLAASGQPPGASQAVSSGAVEPNASHDFQYSVTIPAGQMLASGSYDEPVALRLTGTTGPEPPENAPPSDTANLTLLTTVQDYLGVNIAGAGTMKTINFGELTQGESQRVVIQARSNRNFTLKATSAHSGALTMDAPYQAWQIPYTMSVNSGPVTLPDEIGPFGVTSIAGHCFDLDFTIGDVSGKRAGLYTDEITIEIIPAM